MCKSGSGKQGWFGQLRSVSAAKVGYATSQILKYIVLPVSLLKILGLFFFLINGPDSTCSPVLDTNTAAPAISEKWKPCHTKPNT
jgi:hypothetical protein